ncbi:MAG: hypothetical protein ISS65_08525 [Desulfobacterales bacterium]|uniref:Uracil-DNA glycosylase-like domain-containing protein n=1 Tax=Candidatus Desulfatibia profunda TaxID=2841695 RepID=A0A8J6NTV7_9BACT|nr:hypothetical protein [Candidatus Desulfatibia profunda]MBL7180238.1 hypothetical protein [Desulfobacterales bacterium]
MHTPTKLFQTSQELDSFKLKWPLFLKSAVKYNPKIYQFNDKKQTLAYDSEQLVPTKTGNRPPILLVLGNPASHSVEAGMFFSFERQEKEHRFWKIMRDSGVLDLPVEPHLSIKEQNNQRKQRLLELNYKPPFRVGLCVFISMPSAPSKDYSGVAGIQKLIGAKAMRRLEAAERERVLECAKEFLSPDGAVVAFQKNAWNGLCSENDPRYDRNLARSGKLKGAFIGNPNIPIFCVPPTRYARPCRKILRQILTEKYPDKFRDKIIGN